MEKISKKQVERFPIYLKFLLSVRNQDNQNISAPSIAAGLGLSEEQVRKDLQVVTKAQGKPKSGRNIDELIQDIQNFLGYEKKQNAIVVGVGHLGKAFMNYKGFEEFGFNIVAGFDVNKDLISTKINGKTIHSIYEMGKVVQSLKVKIAILTVPAEVAQQQVNVLINHGIKAIWNFVPTHLDVPEDVVIENMNLASSLAVLSHKLKEKGE